MANFTGLAAARQQVLADAGWDVDRDGLAGGPRVRVLVGRGAARDPRPRAALPRARDADRRRRRRPGPARRRRPRARSGGGERADDRLPAGGQPALGRVRPDGRGDRRRAPARRVGARRRCLRALGGGVTAAAEPRRRATSAPTRGPPTRTRPSTCRTTAAWRSSRTPSRCAGRSACTPSTSRRSAGRATRWRRCPSCPGALAASRCGRCCGRSGRSGVEDLVDGLVANARAIADGIATIDGAEILNDVVFTQVCVGVRLRRADPRGHGAACWPTA